jgi:antitoxin MazE
MTALPSEKSHRIVNLFQTMYNQCRYDHTEAFIMKLTVKKWGNSLAIRIPKEIAALSSIHMDSSVEVEVAERMLILRPVEERTLTLQELLDKITPHNLHKEIYSGEPQGNEIW